MERKTNIDSVATLKSMSGSQSIAERRVRSPDGVGDRIGFGPLRRPRLLHPGARRSGRFLDDRLQPPAAAWRWAHSKTLESGALGEDSHSQPIY